MLNFHPLMMSWAMVQNYRHVNLNWEPMTVSTNENSKDSQEPWPKGFHPRERRTKDNWAGRTTELPRLGLSL